jgi:hypothetical protein
VNHHCGPNNDAPDNTVELAGILAEFGFTSLTLIGDRAEPRTLTARATDLPGAIRAAMPCTLHAHSPAAPHALTITITPQGCTWSAPDSNPALSHALATRLSAPSA